MQFKKLAAAIALGAFALGLGSAQADDKVLRIGVEGEYPPFSSVDPSGKLVGFDIDIAMALCEVMNRECELVPNAWSTIIPSLVEKKYDAIIASMSITEERKKQIDFTIKYYNTPAKFVAAEGADLEISASGLAGKVVGVQKGTTHQCYMEKAFPDAELKLYEDQTDVFRDLANGRLDLQISDSVQAMDGFLNTDEGKGYAFVGGDQYDLECHGAGAGIGIRQEDDDLKGGLTAAIRLIRANGTYAEINAKYFDFDIYGEES